MYNAVNRMKTILWSKDASKLRKLVGVRRKDDKIDAHISLTLLNTLIFTI